LGERLPPRRGLRDKTRGNLREGLNPKSLQEPTSSLSAAAKSSPRCSSRMASNTFI